MSDRPSLGARLMKLLGLAVLATALLAMAFRAPDRPLESLVARWGAPPSDFLELKLPGGQAQLVHFRDEGPRSDTTPIVLLHATASSLHTWEGWVKSLSATRRVITLDLPGFGLTGPSPLGDYSDEAYDSFLLSFLDQLQISRMVLGGNSLGGEIAWIHAARHPERVTALILVDADGLDVPSPTIPPGARMPDWRPLHELIGVFLPRPLIDRGVRAMYGDPSKVTAALVDRYFELTLREGNRVALARRLAQRDPGRHVDLLARIQAPTLILWGGRDAILAPEAAALFHRAIPASQVRMFPALGHVPQEEDPASTVQAVHTFLHSP
ncbi:alpha/beta fold hydrolase [Roseateles sp. MS654]|uniref:alpha/beta fold hydrolase n=1 Tax=Roseateles sp. MS654 TaxID=3412685 RepID=UPI003C2D1A8E